GPRRRRRRMGGRQRAVPRGLEGGRARLIAFGPAVRGGPGHRPGPLVRPPAGSHRFDSECPRSARVPERGTPHSHRPRVRPATARRQTQGLDMTPDQVGFAILILGLALLIGKAIRVNVRWVQELFLPSSIVAGVLLLLFGPQVLGQIVGGGLSEAGLYTTPILETWGALPGLLISVVFATMFLGQNLPDVRRAARLTGPQLSFGLALGSGQYVVGLLLAVLVLVPLFAASPMVGALIEIGFEGGHGTAAGMREVFLELGFESGADLAVGMATVGIVSGIVLGIARINWAVRTGRTELLTGQANASESERRGLFPRDDQQAAGRMTSRPSSIEPFSLHVALVAVAILIGWLI